MGWRGLSATVGRVTRTAHHLGGIYGTSVDKNLTSCATSVTTRLADAVTSYATFASFISLTYHWREISSLTRPHIDFVTVKFSIQSK